MASLRISLQSEAEPYGIKETAGFSYVWAAMSPVYLVTMMNTMAEVNSNGNNNDNNDNNDDSSDDSSEDDDGKV